jgi:putative ABC transport system permease protein
MNLAYKDIRHNLGRFALTLLGVGMLLMVVMAMSGIYRGLVTEGTLLIDHIGADLWIVQRDTRGPFAEISRVPRSLVDRVAVVPGIHQAREFVTHTIQREHRGRRMRMLIVGLSWPADRGQWLPLVAGRPLAQNHFEIIADQSLGLRLGETIRLGKETYTAVGVTRGMTSLGGDGAAFLTLSDALAVQFDLPGEAVRLERAARQGRAGLQDTGRAQPALLEHAMRPAADIPALGASQISAVIATIAPGTDPAGVIQTLSAWPDVSVITLEGQRELILKGVVERSRRQLGLFQLILMIVSAIVMSLIVYTLTLDKLHDLAMLKLIGAPTRVILSLIVQQAVILGMLGFVVANLIGTRLFPLFPRRIVITREDLAQLALAVLGISILASGLAVWRAVRISPNEALIQ